MQFFVKAKFDRIQDVTTGAVAVPELKKRFDDREAAFAWAGEQLTAGATSITIRPERNAR